MEREHGSHIIGALEKAWAAIRAQHPQVPNVVTITGRGQYGLEVTWGHFDPGTWAAGEEPRHELFVGGELIAMGGRRVMQTLLHEAAHGLAHVRNIKDTSNKHRYHNKRFATLARELGLKPPANPESVLGFSGCTITDATAERYKEAIEELESERLPYRVSPLVAYLRNKTIGDDRQGNGKDDDQDDGDGESGPATTPGDDETWDDMPELLEPAASGRDGRRHSVACGCAPPRRFQISPAAFDVGAITCGVCDEEFVVAEPTTPRRPRMPREH